MMVAIKKFKESDEDDDHVTIVYNFIKLLQVRKTVLREIRVLKDFKHENIIKLLQVFRDKGKLYLVFEFMEKTVLEELELTPNGLPPQQIKEMLY